MIVICNSVNSDGEQMMATVMVATDHQVDEGDQLLLNSDEFSPVDKETQKALFTELSRYLQLKKAVHALTGALSSRFTSH